MAEATAQEIELHKLILSGDSLALSKLYDFHGESLIKILKSRYPKHAKLDEALIIESVTEALFGYYKNPKTYDQTQSTLKRFLEVASERDLINLLEKHSKYSKRRKSLPNDVELQKNKRNRATKDNSDPESLLIQSESFVSLKKALSAYFKSVRDIELAMLIISKVRETEKYSEILEITHLDIEEQQLEVKRNKDRIKKVLDREDVESKLKRIFQ
jgi:hypothetical protein